MVAADTISSILFVCGRNAVRSPMARALTEHCFPRRFYTASAGVSPGDPDAFVGAVLSEIGIVPEEHRPLALEELADLNFDLAITLSPVAHHHMLEVAVRQSLHVEYWPTNDPSLAFGSRAQILDAYRDLRNRLKERIIERLSEHPR